MPENNEHWMVRLGVCLPRDVRDELFTKAQAEGLTASQYARILLSRDLRPVPAKEAA